MPRKALYNIDQVLSLSIDVLLEHGYHGTILDELIARTDFNRRGFYLEFSSKQEFFYKVILHYQETQLNPIVSHLDSHQGLVSIEQFFEAYIELVNGKGCLLINAITELGYDDDKIKDIGRHYIDRLQLGFIGCLENAQQKGQIRSDINIESTALQLTSYVQGFAVNGIIASGTDELKIATRALLGPLSN
ncbi:TetR/AcrR family transcriptional regulator [Alteromonadaceae bacterium M269]|nr:TetR/AcrR family transcriptional regulator [Alteromonadaceae bacterium M269]